MISSNVPAHLLVTARTGFLTTAEPEVPSYADIAVTLPMDANSQDLVDIGGAPMPTIWKGRPEMQDFIEKKLTVKTEEWTIKVGISYRAVRDDKTGELKRKVEAAGDNFQLDIAQKVYATLNDGESLIGYDGLPFFSEHHVDKGAAYTAEQSNIVSGGTDLDVDGVEDVLVPARRFRNDQGNFVNYGHDLLVVAPELERAAAVVTGKGLFLPTDTASANPYAGTLNYRVSEQFDSTAWMLLATKRKVKPVIIAMREKPGLRAANFDADGPDGGMYYFWFGASYDHYLGDWRTAILGKS